MIGAWLVCTLTVPLELPTLGTVWTTYTGSCKVAHTDQPALPIGEPLHLYMDCTEDLEFITRPNKTWKVSTKFWTRLGDDCHE